MKLRSLLIIGFFLISAPALFAQKANQARIVSPKELSAEFGDSLRYEGMPIFRGYEYRDKAGVYTLLFCEDNKEIDGTDTVNTKIKAVCLLNDNGGFLEKWRINDALVNEPDDEISIWFWTKFSTFTDVDGDGYIEPVIVYGSSVSAGIQRLKIITVYKGKKYAIRAVECDFDDCRQLRFDLHYKTLPASIKQHNERIMERLRKERDLILHEG